MKKLVAASIALAALVGAPASAADHASVGLIVVAGERPYISLDRVTPAAAALNADIEPGPVIDGEGWFLGC